MERQRNRYSLPLVVYILQGSEGKAFAELVGTYPDPGCDNDHGTWCDSDNASAFIGNLGMHGAAIPICQWRM